MIWRVASLKFAKRSAHDKMKINSWARILLAILRLKDNLVAEINSTNGIRTKKGISDFEKQKRSITQLELPNLSVLNAISWKKWSRVIWMASAYYRNNFIPKSRFWNRETKDRLNTGQAARDFYLDLYCNPGIAGWSLLALSLSAWTCS